jgi:transcriptional regulator
MTTVAARVPEHLRAAIVLLATGRATAAEVARLLNTSRQNVNQLARRNGIDIPAARNNYLEKVWRAQRRGDEYE